MFSKAETYCVQVETLYQTELEDSSPSRHYLFTVFEFEIQLASWYTTVCSIISKRNH